MKSVRKILLHAKRRIPALVFSTVLFLCFGLYYLGVFDISFLNRPASWEKNFTLLCSFLSRDEKPEPEAPPETPVPDKKPEKEESDDDKPAETEDPEQEEEVINPYSVLPGSSQLEAEGYSRTDKVFGEGFRFAVFETGFKMPRAFSYSQKTYEKVQPVYSADGAEATVETVTVTEDRPALELYMGYIIYDDMGKLYLVGPDGTPLCEYNENRFKPAYTRDTLGRPLFYDTYKYDMDYPTSLGEPDENGNRPWTSKATLKLTGKNYYFLGGDGRTFVKSDYNDATDNRGLYFDYPAYYGLSDNKLSRYYKESTKVTTSLDGKTTVSPSMQWLYRLTSNTAFNPDAETTVYPYTMAYNYRGGYATVRADVKWSYEDKDKNTVEVTSNELQVVNENGKVMFNSRKNYVSEYKWMANERYEEPLIRDKSALGSYYFENGLMRIRRQSYDSYYFTEYDTIKIVSDDDILIRPDGTQFYTPAGYKLEAYSDGMILLSRDGKYGYMDYTGKWIIQPKLEYASPFFEGVAVIKRSGKYGAIDTKGNNVVPARYDYLSDVSSGLMAAYSKSEGWCIYVKMSK